jgi:hypothetical protein
MKLLQIADQELNSYNGSNRLTNCTMAGDRRLFRRAQIRKLIEAETSTGTPKTPLEGTIGFFKPCFLGNQLYTSGSDEGGAALAPGIHRAVRRLQYNRNTTRDPMALTVRSVRWETPGSRPTTAKPLRR